MESTADAVCMTHESLPFPWNSWKSPWTNVNLGSASVNLAYL